eukprot:CAMPEP_0171764726 /NCGR_PEP_ID=MMETSP0991-20121206/50171_1 /TAXON_ID=483369 /ORGANISM="non described non described, Strain CCMP2098" /LENGTH=44 /DNA_ID= /DNA_START= /DNA_END= /DNA_ORIENTATION=
MAPTLFTYNQVVRGFSKAGRWEDAFELMDTLERQGLKPDKFIFG